VVLQGDGVEPQHVADVLEQRRRVDAEVGGALGLRQDLGFQEGAQQPAQLGSGRARPGGPGGRSGR
jgi:hypothetical protein